MRPPFLHFPGIAGAQCVFYFLKSPKGRPAALRPLDGDGKPRRLVDGALRIQLRGNQGAADQIDLHPHLPKRLFKRRFRNLPGANDDGINRQRLVGAANRDMQAVIVNAAVLDPGQHPDTGFGDFRSSDLVGRDRQGFAKPPFGSLQHGDGARGRGRRGFFGLKPAADVIARREAILGFILVARRILPTAVAKQIFHRVKTDPAGADDGNPLAGDDLAAQDIPTATPGPPRPSSSTWTSTSPCTWIPSGSRARRATSSNGPAPPTSSWTPTASSSMRWKAMVDRFPSRWGRPP